ncbi:MAG: hypothetical protein HS104_40370 [Polyangiaceae bacterium]|nr:hypothetical protein [Polyangiaceae bacterium]MBK8999867.1 hypothetical protein [Myxococcales bacterium]MCE7893683.1 hypothetical protein [Sorangiineae bacterium PRO1]MCL4749576.1 hypothetical protein [Myxococcales bacterium]
MTERERLSTTLGILLAGLLQAEEEEAESQRRPRIRSESGVFRVGEEGLGPLDPPFDPGDARL